MLDAIWFRLLEWAERAAKEENGATTVEWVVIAVGMAAAAAAVVALLRPAIEHAANKIVSALGG